MTKRPTASSTPPEGITEDDIRWAEAREALLGAAADSVAIRAKTAREWEKVAERKRQEAREDAARHKAELIAFWEKKLAEEIAEISARNISDIEKRRLIRHAHELHRQFLELHGEK